MFLINKNQIEEIVNRESNRSRRRLDLLLKIQKIDSPNPKVRLEQIFQGLVLFFIFFGFLIFQLVSLK
jgi:hypothetical protein